MFIVFGNLHCVTWNYVPRKPQTAAISKTCSSTGACGRLLRRSRTCHGYSSRPVACSEDHKFLCGKGWLFPRNFRAHDADTLQTFGDGGLTNTHPAFLWAFRASHNWTALKDLLPGVKQHLENDPIASLYYPGISKPRRHYPPLVEDFAVTFKELFSVAADSLASHLNQPLDRLGVIFEEPVSTGTVSGINTARLSKGSRKSSSTFSQEDLEKGGANSFLGKGQILFVVRQLDKYEVEKLAAHGYRFAAIPKIG